jgi:hypothetical protein
VDRAGLQPRVADLVDAHDGDGADRGGGLVVGEVGAVNDVQDVCGVGGPRNCERTSSPVLDLVDRTLPPRAVHCCVAIRPYR